MWEASGCGNWRKDEHWFVGVQPVFLQLNIIWLFFTQNVVYWKIFSLKIMHAERFEHARVSKNCYFNYSLSPLVKYKAICDNIIKVDLWHTGFGHKIPVKHHIKCFMKFEMSNNSNTFHAQLFFFIVILRGTRHEE